MSGLTPTLIWAILGLVLLTAEIFTLSFAVMFFGLSALTVAGLKAVFGLDHLGAEIVIFAVLGFSCILIFRSRLLKAFGSRGDFTADKAKVILLTADVPAHTLAKVEYQGTVWDAYNDTDTPLRRGDKALVAGTEGIKLIVRPYHR